MESYNASPQQASLFEIGQLFSTWWVECVGVRIISLYECCPRSDFVVESQKVSRPNGMRFMSSWMLVCNPIHENEHGVLLACMAAITKSSKGGRLDRVGL